MSVVDCFPIGSIVACTTCFNENIEGSVLAFDPAIKMLILSTRKCPNFGKNTARHTNLCFRRFSQKNTDLAAIAFH